MKKNITRFLQVFLGIITLVILAYALFRRLDNDEIEALHTTWKVLFQGTIYKDFFQNHHPFLYYLLAPLIKIFGETTHIIYLARLLMFSMFLGIGYATYLLTKFYTQSKNIALLSVIFLYTLPIFTVKAIEIRPDVPMVLCGMFGIVFWQKYLTTQKIQNMVWSGLLLAASFLFLQKAIFFLFFFGLTALPYWYNKTISFKEILICKISFLAPVLGYFLYLVAGGSFYSYLTFAWLFNMNIADGCPPWDTLRFAFLTNIPFWLALTAGVFYTCKNAAYKKLWEPMFLGGTLFITFFFTPYSYSQYLLPALPFISILAAFGFTSIIKQRKSQLIRHGAIFLIAIPPLCTNYIRRMIFSPVSEQIEKINYVLSKTDRNDYVLDSEIGFKGFNLFRKDIDFFWLGVLSILPTYNKIKPYKYNVFKLIQEKKPAAIGKLSITKIPKEGIDKNYEFVIKEYYKVSEKYDDLFLRKK